VSITAAPSLRQQVAESARRLAGVAEQPRFEAELLWAHVLGLSRVGLIAADDVPPRPDILARAALLVERRAQGEPMAYLLGRREFWSLHLRVTPDVLIPRPETEGLVQWALEDLSEGEVRSVADLGTGSGAIALAIASERPQARVIATDASPAALALARDNARALGLERVEFRRGDWCTPLAAVATLDLIVSNPPYVAAGDPCLEALRYEPLNALVAGADGLDAIRRITTEARYALRAGGHLRLEHGTGQGAAVRALFADAGFVAIETRRDLAGHERVTGGRWL
jgi:release factor glutamine methyltransferase